MKDLRIIENELVPVYVTSTGEKVVYGTELHAVLQVKSRFNDWVHNRLKDCEAVENEDFQAFTKNLVKGGRPEKEYIIKLDIAKEMAMLERNRKGKQVRHYFIQVEKKYKESGQIASQGNQALLETLWQLLEKQTEFIEKQDAFNRNITKKFESLDDYVPERRVTDFSYIAQEFTVNERKDYLYELVRENAELRDISVNNFLHVMYGEIEREFDVMLNSYRSVYRSEMGNPDASMVEVIAANDRFYKLAVDLSKFMIKDYKEQAALAEGINKFKG